MTVILKKYAEIRGIAPDFLGQYNMTKGIINDYVAKLLKNDENIVISPDDIVMTDGAQEEMAILINTLFDKNDVLLVIWVFTAWTMLSFNPKVSSKSGWLWVLAYAASVCFFRPMTLCFSSLKNIDPRLSVDLQRKNKITALVLLIVKLMMFITVLLLALTGIVLSIKLLLLWCGGKDIILPIHKALITGTLLLSSLQLGINLANIPLPPLFAKKESIIRYFAIVIMLIGTIVLVF